MRAALAHARVLVRERRSGFDPSNPQMAGGEKLDEFLVAQHPAAPAPPEPTDPAPGARETRPAGSGRGSSR